MRFMNGGLLLHLLLSDIACACAWDRVGVAEESEALNGESVADVDRGRRGQCVCAFN